MQSVFFFIWMDKKKYLFRELNDLPKATVWKGLSSVQI